MPGEAWLPGGVLPVLRLPVGRSTELNPGAVRDALAETGCTGQQKYL
jgi:hypothetical protein